MKGHACMIGTEVERNEATQRIISKQGQGSVEQGSVNKVA